MEFAPETILHNRYRIMRQLGQGGMGAVYMAFDQSLEHIVAVKHNRSRTEEASTQFLTEARLLASLRHPNLPRVIDYFLMEGDQFLVMDYIAGEDLEHILQNEGAQPVEKVLQWAEELGEALAYLHRQTPPVIHRDIKPGNLKLTEEGQVILVDFGIAKASDSSQKTSTGALGYTPGYAPPEQYGSGRTGPYSDQYAFAATLYALLTGQKPVDAAQRVLGQAVLTPMSLLNPTLSTQVVSAIERALSIRPDERFPNVESFTHALTGATVMQPPRPQPETAAHARTAQPSAPKAKGKVAWGALLAGLLGLALLTVAVGVFLVLGSAKRNQSATSTAQALAAVLPTATQPSPPTATLPQAKASATQPLPTETPSPEPTASATATLTLAPSATPTLEALGGGGKVAFVSDRGDGKTAQIYLMSVALDANGSPLAGDPQVLTSDLRSKSQLAWSPDGTRLLYAAPKDEASDKDMEIWLFDLASGQSTNLTLNPVDDDIQPAWAWNPETCKQEIVYTRRRWINQDTGSYRSQLYRMDPEGGNKRQIQSDYLEFSPNWSPNMDWLLFVVQQGDFLFLRQRSTQTEFKTPMPYDLKENVGRFGNVEDPAISPDGRSIAYTRVNGKQRAIYNADWAARGDKTLALTTSGDDQQPHWSPDSQWLVFSSGRDGNREVYVMTYNGMLQTNLSQNPAQDAYPAWQPVAQGKCVVTP